jgi:hypothetical protein
MRRGRLNYDKPAINGSMKARRYEYGERIAKQAILWIKEEHVRAPVKLCAQRIDGPN